MRPLLVTLVCAAVGIAAPVPKDLKNKKQDDNTAIVGTWKVNTLTVNGKVSNISTEVFVFSDTGEVRTLTGGRDGGSVWKWTLDPAAAPPAMRWNRAVGGSDWECVYELSGDTLKVGFIGKGSARPEKVEPGPSLTLYEMTRDTSAK
jgi:uncharacterized protein (TIGR03067 family)